jgi:ferredoxin
MEAGYYQRLAEHLNDLPGGFAPSETGAEVPLLKELFTPDEAQLAIHLTLEREPARAIAERAGLSAAETEHRLDEMARKGLILSIRVADGSLCYQAAPWIVGIYEFQVNNLNEDFLRALGDYWSSRRPQQRAPTISQMRTIPIGQSIEPHLEALPYEQVDAIVEAQDTFAVAPCICRRSARLQGKGCDAPEESCLMFGEFADYYASTGRGRYIDRSEMKELLAKADAANLVLQPNNSQDVVFICCCCGCCCGVLRGLKHHPKPAEEATSRFIAQLDSEVCQGCWACLDRCQMEALSEDGDRVTLDLDRCIGCGLCVSTCPSEALTLVRRPDRAQVETPIDLNATWRTIQQTQAYEV